MYEVMSITEQSLLWRIDVGKRKAKRFVFDSSMRQQRKSSMSCSTFSLINVTREAYFEFGAIPKIWRQAGK